MTTATLVEAKATLVSEYFTGEKGILKTYYKTGCGSFIKLNKAKFKNKEAVRWGFRQGFLSHDQYEYQMVCSWEQDIYRNGCSAPDAEYLDAEILWTILGEMVKNYHGRTIIRDEVWHKLGINPFGDTYHTDRDYEKQWRILGRLAQAGYVWFQSCADVWNIEVRH